MKKPEKFKKIKKLLRDPDLFFYDMFRKRINNKFRAKIENEGAAAFTRRVTYDECQVDWEDLNRLGLRIYAINKLGAGIGARDGQDPNGLLLWSEKLYNFFDALSHYCNKISARVDIFNSNGERFNAASGIKLDAAHLLALFCKRANFVLELSTPNEATEVFNIHLYDVDDADVAIVRSNKAWIKKFPASKIGSLYNGERPLNLKIDAVYTWVNQADPAWQKLWLQTFPQTPYDKDRYTDNNELQYSLRSLSKYAPWVNRIFIVSNCSKPDWLGSNDRIRWIDHQEIFPDQDVLPTFNSHAIECCLHRIPDLQENFIYLNDDFFLSHPCLQSDFFDNRERSIAYFEPYGMISHFINDQDPDYLIAAKNSQRLLSDLFPEYEARQLHRHVPYALKKSVLSEIENKLHDAFTITRQAKTRSSTDINLTSFFYHHYASAQGTAVCGELSSHIVRPTNIVKILNQDTYKYKILCFNDGNGSALDAQYKELSTKYFKFRYHQKALWETGSINSQTNNEPTSL